VFSAFFFAVARSAWSVRVSRMMYLPAVIALAGKPDLSHPLMTMSERVINAEIVAAFFDMVKLLSHHEIEVALFFPVIYPVKQEYL
jgi:hypothetical protein